MIRIYRPAKIPITLTRRGKLETKLLCDQYDENPADYDSARMKCPAYPEVYGSATVKRQLIEFHKNKCCYSEVKFNRDPKPVEHFRPKGAVRQTESTVKQYPGYYWLTYEWSNLLLCKTGINSNKTDYFPLYNEAARAKNHHCDLSLENPVLIDPASEDPRKHIRFHNEEPYAYRSSDRGERTIKLLLRHPDLDESRRTHFQRLFLLKRTLEILSGSSGTEEKILVAEIRVELDAAIQPDAEYSSMAIDLLS